MTFGPFGAASVYPFRFAMRFRLAAGALAVLLLSACDSGLDAGPLFDALEGTWTSEADPSTVQFLPGARYAFVADGDVTEAGRVSLASDGDAPDPDALGALRQIQFFPDDEGASGASFFTVVSADASTLSVQQCFGDCEGVPVDTYRRQ